MVRDSRDGLWWDDSSFFELVPRWTREPSLEAIERLCRRQLGLDRPEDTCAVSFFASGAFNKLYLVSAANNADPMLLRVSLPVHPHLKTRGEVAALQWVRDHTDTIPVPKVVAFQDRNDNEIGFEWILMERMPGTPAYRRWRTMSMKQKIALTERVAEFQAQLSYNSNNGAFRTIGTLDAGSDRAGVAAPGQVVSHQFFMQDRLRFDHVPRGPFRSSHDWLHAQLTILILEKQQILLDKTADEDDKEDAEDVSHAAERLRSLLPKVFPPTTTPGDSPLPETEATAIVHDDLNLNNILVDDQGKITAIVDWECVSALPIWMATRMPLFLQHGGREEEPNPEIYAPPSPSALEKDQEDMDNLDNEGKSDMFWEHRMEYEVTQLQKVYASKLKELWPDWPVEDSQSKVDFYEAMLQCDAGVFVKQVERWADSLERGEVMRWDDVFDYLRV